MPRCRARRGIRDKACIKLPSQYCPTRWQKYTGRTHLSLPMMAWARALGSWLAQDGSGCALYLGAHPQRRVRNHRQQPKLFWLACSGFTAEIGGFVEIFSRPLRGPPSISGADGFDAQCRAGFRRALRALHLFGRAASAICRHAFRNRSFFGQSGGSLFESLM
jgi:hypothetical protein